MFGLGFPELLLIFVIALVVFGPKKLPELGKSIGRAMAEFKKASDEFQESVREEMKEVEKTTGVEEIKKLGKLDLTGYDKDDEPKPALPQDAEQKPEEKKSEENKENV
jgi:TatA/E family protein of Tat protein translocase